MIINRLGYGEEYPYPGDPQNFSQFTPAAKYLKQWGSFRYIRMSRLQDAGYVSIWLQNYVYPREGVPVRVSFLFRHGQRRLQMQDQRHIIKASAPEYNRKL
jgi:hypothetical protein